MRPNACTLVSVFALFTASVAARAADEPAVPDGLLPHDRGHMEHSVLWCAIHIARNELAQAISDCTFAIYRNPLQAEAFSNRGAAYFKAGDFAAALVDFDRAFVRSPGSPMIRFNKGTALSNLGRHQEAIEEFSAAIELDPTLSVAYSNRGCEYELLGQRSAALADYRKAIELAPSLESAREALRRLGGE